MSRLNFFDWLIILGVFLIILKLIGCATISWWWVLAPFWFPLALVVLLAAIALTFGLYDKIRSMLP